MAGIWLCGKSAECHISYWSKVPGLDSLLCITVLVPCQCRPWETASRDSSNWVSASKLVDLIGILASSSTSWPLQAFVE